MEIILLGMAIMALVGLITVGVVDEIQYRAEQAVGPQVMKVIVAPAAWDMSQSLPTRQSLPWS